MNTIYHKQLYTDWLLILNISFIPRLKNCKKKKSTFHAVGTTENLTDRLTIWVSGRISESLCTVIKLVSKPYPLLLNFFSSFIIEATSDSFISASVKIGKDLLTVKATFSYDVKRNSVATR